MEAEQRVSIVYLYKDFKLSLGKLLENGGKNRAGRRLCFDIFNMMKKQLFRKLKNYYIEIKFIVRAKKACYMQAFLGYMFA